MTEEQINQVALSKYPIDEFWIGDLATGRMYDQNARDRAVFIKGIKEALKIADVSNRRELFDDFYKWLDGLTQAEYDDMSLTDKIEKYFFKN